MYQFSFGLAGYGDDAGESTSLNKMMKASHAMDKKSGRSIELAEQKTEKEKAMKEWGSGHPKVVALDKAIAALEKKDNAAATATLDATKLEFPSEAAWEYAGWGIGNCFDLSKAKLPSTDIEEYSVSFDVRISGSKPLDQSKFSLSFVVDDGKGMVADDDDFDDVILQLGRGTAEGEETLEFTDEYQTFTFELKDLDVQSGDAKKLADVELKGVVFNIQAQGSPYEIGTDKDNVLYVDNLRLIHNKK